VARETMVRALGLKGYSPEETAEIRDVILEQTRTTIEAMSHSNGNQQKGRASAQ
jgi:hypothetical protein